MKEVLLASLKLITTLFMSFIAVLKGHGFSRAEGNAQLMRLQPLREVLPFALRLLMKNAITSLRPAAEILLLGIASLAVPAQIVSTNAQNRPAVAKPDAVTFLFPEQVTVPAGKPSPVAQHFRVAQGLHINSHTPSDEYLIATDFSIPEGSGVRLDGAAYPAGTLFTLPADPKTRLSVYTGEFVIQARIVAVVGSHLVEGKLRYQACDRNQCLPPKTIDVPIEVIGK